MSVRHGNMNFRSFINLLAHDLAAAEKLIQTRRELLELRSSAMEETPLHYFAIEDGRDVVRMLLRNRADVNATNASRQTALMNAAQLNHSEMVLLLLEHGAEHSLKDENDDTALHVGAEVGSMKAMGALIEAGADVAEPNGCGQFLEEIVPQKKLAELGLLLQVRAAPAVRHEGDE